MTRPRTLYEKIWDAHVVERRPDGTCLIFIDRHLVHEVTSPQAFAGLRASGRTVRRPDLTLAVPDHNVPTTARLDAAGNKLPIADAESAAQLAALEKNAPEYGIRYIDAVAPEQGIVHVVGPEQGFSLPGTTIVCGDSHTACHGGIGALAFGIGTSEVEHVLATQTLLLQPAKTMEVRVERSEEHTSELQSLMRISYAVFCLKKKKNNIVTTHITQLRTRTNQQTYHT